MGLSCFTLLKCSRSLPPMTMLAQSGCSGDWSLHSANPKPAIVSRQPSPPIISPKPRLNAAAYKKYVFMLYS